MGIEVTVVQRGLIKKQLPLEVLLGYELCYGDFSGESLELGKIGETGIIVFHPERIARGIAIAWTAKTKKQIVLNLPLSTTNEEICTLYDVTERICGYWRNSAIYIDGEPMSLGRFKESLSDYYAYSSKALKEFSEKIVAGEHEQLTLFSTMWPLVMGRAEAEMFLSDSGAFGRWLNEKQQPDAAYSSPIIYFDKTEECFKGVFIFINDVDYILPITPKVPFGTIDKRTGKELECTDWRVEYGDRDREELMKLPYSEFVKRLPGDRISRFDASHIYVKALSSEELDTM